MTKTPFILSDQPYGTERSYNARGIADGELAEGTSRGTLNQLTDWTTWADRVLVF